MKSLALLALTAAALCAQSFESVSITRFVPSDDSDERPVGQPGSMLYSDVSLRLLIAAAYNVRPDQISGPGWLDGERYDIQAKPPADATREQVPAMIRSMLADQFKLKIQTEDRPRVGYVLLAGKSESKPEKTNLVTGGDFSVAKDHVDITGVTMANFAGLLASLIKRTVTDQTGLQGHFNIRINLTLEQIKAAPPELIPAIQEAGLVLEERASTVKYVVVERN